MDATDTLRGGHRHELAVDLGDARGLDGEGEQVRTGETNRLQGAWGCTRVSPVAGACRLDARPAGGGDR